MPTGAELFIDTIVHLGIGEMFTLVGDHLNEVLLYAPKRGVRIIDMRHESAVTHAADVWARVHRRPSVSLVTGGPGHTNSLTGIATAFLAGSPLIAVSGASPASQAHRGAFQDLDQVATARPLVKWAAQPAGAAQIPRYVAQAYAEAVSGRMGPVHLTIPVDLFRAQATTPMPEVAQVSRPAPDPDALNEAVSVLRAAERPVVIAGSGVWWAGAEDELVCFAEHTNLPVFTIGLARGAVRDDHPLCMGYADPALSRAAARIFAEADCFLVLGKRIDFRLGMGGPRVIPREAKVIQVDIHPQELGLNRRLDVAGCGDLKPTLQALADGPPWPARPWLDRLRHLRGEWLEQLDRTGEDHSTPLHPAALFRELKRLLPQDVLISWDGGDFAHWGRAILSANVPGGWVRLGPLATIGAALPNAVALQLAHPSSPVVLITGDGALGFYIAELDTAVRHRLPLVIIVGNDAAWGIERELQGGRDTVACELRRTRYDAVMQGFGGDGETVDTIEEIAPALARAWQAEGPYLINVDIRGVRSPFTEWKLAGG
jgi:acetolactate synthase-1/2/3 large subunit